MSDRLGGEPATHHDHARVNVTVGFKSWVGGVPNHLWSGCFEIAESDTHGLRQEVESVIQQARSDGNLPPFEIIERRGQASWGADSGEVVNVVLWIGETVTSGFIAAGIAELMQRLSERSASDATVASTISREEAVSRARWTIAEHYGKTAEYSPDASPVFEEELTVVSERKNVEDGEWTVTLRDDNRTSYRVHFGHISGLPTVKEIVRWVSD